jgi:hypothetical protein
MTEQEIINSNKLIAEFMGAKFNWNNVPDDCWLPRHGVCRFNKIGVGNGKILEYHKSFDWIMPVVEKIESLTFGNTTQFDVVIDKRGCCITQYFYGGEHQKWQTGLYNSLNKIESVWKCCVDFIKWFNTVDKTNLNESK